MEVSLGQRLARFVALVGMLFVIVMAVLVSDRLSQDALALTLGLACGVAAMAPTVLLAVLLWRRAERSAAQNVAPATPATPYATPPVIVLAPPALPAANNGEAYRYAGPPSPWTTTAPGERKFVVMGED